MRRPKLQLYTKILIALVLGAAFGLAANRFGFSTFVATYIKPVGSAFIRLISMVVVPLVFASLLVGTASLKDIRTVGRIGAKTLAYYLSTTAIAVSIGLLLTSVVPPGSSLPQEARQNLVRDAGVQKDLPVQASREKSSIKDLVLNIIPTNPIKAMTEGKMLQIIFFALLAGVCLTLIPAERGQPVIDFFKSLNEIIAQKGVGIREETLKSPALQG